MTGLTRRRFLTIAAGGAAALAVGGAAGSAPAYSWRGVALGAEAAIHLDGIDPEHGRAVVAACRGTIARLESLFSLYRTDSALSRLNRDGRLDDPDPEFLALLSRVRAVHAATDGAFDPTVQPLWAAYAERITGGGDITGWHPDRQQVGFEHVSFGTLEVAYAKPAMAMTLNGIAQGFITDRIAERLRGFGLAHVLVNMGEIRALDGRRDGTGWPVSLAHEGSGGTVLHLTDRSIATSAALGTVLDPTGRLGHIIDPGTQRPLRSARTVTVTAPDATLADALSTAFCVMDRDRIADALRRFADAELVAA